jgi:pyridoxine 4-dehydrogenase
MNIQSYMKLGGAGLTADSSALQADLEAIHQHLGTDQGGKNVDVYECARRDLRFSVEENMYQLLSLSSQTYTNAEGCQQKGKGLFDHISLSEVGLETIQKAVKVAPIAFVEIEVSPWERTAFDLGIVDYCSQHQIPILAYSPLGKGLLSGDFTADQKFSDGDFRRIMDRLTGDNLRKNLELAQEFKKAAAEYTPPITPAQLGLVWLIASSPDPHNKVIIPLPGTSKAHRAKENADAATIHISPDVKARIDRIVGSFQPAGQRYHEGARKHNFLWA